MLPRTGAVQSQKTAAWGGVFIAHQITHKCSLDSVSLGPWNLLMGLEQQPDLLSQGPSPLCLG